MGLNGMKTDNNNHSSVVMYPEDGMHVTHKHMQLKRGMQKGIISHSLCQHPVESVLHAGQERGQATKTATSIIQI